jgi:hypothetical protein
MCSALHNQNHACRARCQSHHEQTTHISARQLAMCHMSAMTQLPSTFQHFNASPALAAAAAALPLIVQVVLPLQLLKLIYRRPSPAAAATVRATAAAAAATALEAATAFLAGSSLPAVRFAAAAAAALAGLLFIFQALF